MRLNVFGFPSVLSSSLALARESSGLHGNRASVGISGFISFIYSVITHRLIFFQLMTPVNCGCFLGGGAVCEESCLPEEAKNVDNEDMPVAWTKFDWTSCSDDPGGTTHGITFRGLTFLTNSMISE